MDIPSSCEWISATAELIRGTISLLSSCTSCRLTENYSHQFTITFHFRDHSVQSNNAPDYIASLLMPASDIHSRSSLRSSSNCDLVVPRTRQKTGDWAFSVAAPRAWNRLPTDLKLLAFDCFIQEQTEKFYVSCCLHWEHCLNSGMRHRSACRGRTTSHCCYCYC